MNPRPIFLRFKVAWQAYRVGQVITPAPILRKWLIDRGYCEVVEKAEEVKTALAEPPPSDLVSQTADLASTVVQPEKEPNHDFQPGTKGRPRYPARGKHEQRQRADDHD
jgi:hypothetical protein